MSHLGAPDSIRLLDPLFTTDGMREVLSDRQRLQGMLDFEAALARALASAGIAPKNAVGPIESQCRAELFDVESLARAAALSGNVAIPMVKALTQLVAKADTQASTFVHWGATSQDAIDTGLVLQLRAAFDLLDRDLSHLSDALARLAEAHKSTLVAGRTWLQQGPPVTLGLKAAGWLTAIERHRERLSDSRKQALALQFGGAVGTLAALEDRGSAVAAALARDLRLDLPELPWHAHRDRLAEVAASLGLLAGSLGKMARDISLDVADRDRRSRRALRPGPRRLFHHAAQAQSRRLRDNSGRRSSRSRACLHHADGHGAGARTRLGGLARRMGNAAGNFPPGGRSAWRT